MPNLSLPACLFMVAALTPAFAETEATCDKPFETNLRSGAVLTLDVRSGDIDIVGGESAVVRVSCSSLSHPEDLRSIRISFESSGPSGKLTVKDGPRNDVRIRIEVPARTHLAVNCPAGDVEITGIRGDKTVYLKAGDLKIDVGDPADYAEVEASVKAGDLHLSAFGTNKGGLFRSYSKRQSTGTYALKAHLWAGDITLR